MKTTTTIGIFSTGLETYWPQFDGLRDKLEVYRKDIVQRLGENEDVTIVDAGMVDNTERAHEAAAVLRQNRVDLVFLYIATYSLSSTVLPIAQRLSCPVIILNLQPGPSIDYRHINSLGDRGKMTGLWLENCQACSVPEVACVFNRAGLRYDIVTGHLSDMEAWKEIREWVSVARVVSSMRNNRLGILGHYYNGMLDVYTDITLQSIVFGTQMEMVEMCELKRYRDEATAAVIGEKIAELHSQFDVSERCEPHEIERAARTSIALDRLVETHELGSMAYYYEGSAGNPYEDLATSVIAGNTLLTGRGIPVAGECEVKNVQAMKILSLLGAGGSFSEFYALDFKDDIVMLGHDGPAHHSIAEGCVGLVPLPVYHGKPGNGLSIQMTVKHGPVTLLSVCEGRDGIFLLAAEGESVPGPTLDIGNTNSRYRFRCGAKAFIDRWSKAGPSHHCAIGTGHHLSTLRKIADLFDIPLTSIE